MTLLPVLLLFSPAAETGGAEAIMARVAENQDRAEQMRTSFVYHQSVLVRLNRNNGKLAREEYSEYTVSPMAKGVKKERTLFLGKLVDGRKTVEFHEPGWEHKGIDIDADLARDLADDLTNDKHSKDGIARDLFPLRSRQQREYAFKLEGTEDYRGVPVYRITFEPKVKHSGLDIDEGSAWAGEVLVHQQEYQPVLITSHLAAKIPLWVKTALGTDIQQLGFKISYQKFDQGLWFPVTYGGEFKVRALFLYARRVGISMQNSGFQRAQVESKVEFAPVQ
jgi:hypothetical protein